RKHGKQRENGRNGVSDNCQSSNKNQPLMREFPGEEEQEICCVKQKENRETNGAEQGIGHCREESRPPPLHYRASAGNQVEGNPSNVLKLFRILHKNNGQRV